MHVTATAMPTIQYQFKWRLFSRRPLTCPYPWAGPQSRLQRLDLIIELSSICFNLCFTQSAMSCRPWEEPTPVSEPPHPVTPTKQSRNDGASRAHPDPEDPYRLSDEEEGIGAKKIRPPRHVLQYEVVKRWVTGERAGLTMTKLILN